MPARTSRDPALALWRLWKSSREFCIRLSFLSSFRADLTTRAWFGLADLADRRQLLTPLRAESGDFPKLVRLSLRRFAVVKRWHVLDLRCGDVKFAVWSPA